MASLTEIVGELRRRIIWRGRAAAICRIAATVVAVGLALAALDSCLQYDGRGLLGISTVLLAATAFWKIVRNWRALTGRQWSDLAVARRVEARFPELGDALASSVQFLAQPESDPKGGSPQLRRLVIFDTEERLASLPVEEINDRAPLRRAAGCLVIALFAAVGWAAWDHASFTTALARLAMPFGDVEWPRRNNLAFDNPPTVLAAGSNFEVALIDTQGEPPEDVYIEYAFEEPSGGRRITERMERAGDKFRASRDGIRSSFSFRARGGDDNTMPWHRVEVLSPAQLTSVAITVHPPAYTGWASSAADKNSRVLRGSSIEIDATANEALRSARIRLGEVTVPVAVHEVEGKPGARKIKVARGEWVPQQSGTYQVVLESERGAIGTALEGSLRVDPDAPPAISWRGPAEDLFVTTMARVPIALEARDDLAIQRVELVYERSGATASENAQEEGTTEPGGGRVVLFDGPAAVPVDVTNTGSGAAGDTRTIEYTWDLDALRLPSGRQLVVYGEATDYQPETGRTAVPRKLTIVTAAELDARFAALLQEIIRRVEAALAAQSDAQVSPRRLSETGTELGDVERREFDSSAYLQRRVRQLVTEPASGVTALVESMRASLDMNRVDRSDLHELLARVETSAMHLGDELLPAAEGAFREAIAAADSRPDDIAGLLGSLTTAQEAAAEALRDMLADLSGAADFRRFARELARLRDDQTALQRSARETIDRTTYALSLSELTPSQRTRLDSIAASQSALGERYATIRAAMGGALNGSSSFEADQAQRLREAVDLADRLNLRGDLEDANRRLRENRVGGALQLQAVLSEHLQEVVDLLGGTRVAGPGLAAGLRQAEQELEQRRRDVRGLESALAGAGREPSPTLRAEAERLRGDIEKLAEELMRLDAPSAGASTQRAADHLHDGSDGPASTPTLSPSQARAAEEELAKAAEEISARRRREEENLAKEFVERFQGELDQMVARQEKVVARGADVVAQATDEASSGGGEIAKEERALAELAHEHSELLFGLVSVRLALEDVERRLEEAASLFDRAEPSPQAQVAAESALTMLRAMGEAFQETGEANPPPGGQGAGRGSGDSRPPTFDLLEIKMLRLLQTELNRRTAEHREQFSRAERLAPNDSEAVRAAEAARELAAEQARLEEIVEQMLSRDDEARER